MKVQIINNNGYFGTGPFKSDKDKKRQKPRSRSVFEPAFGAVPQTPSQNTGIDGSLPVDPFEAQRQSQEQQRLEAVVFEERQQQLAQRRVDQLAKKGPDNGYIIPATDPEDVYLRTLETPEQTPARRAAELPNRLWPDETLEEKQERARKAQDYRRGLERAAFWTDLEDRLAEHEDASAIESRRNKFLADRLWPDEGKTIDDVIAAYQEEQINKLADYEIAWEDREIEKRLADWDAEEDHMEALAIENLSAAASASAADGNSLPAEAVSDSVQVISEAPAAVPIQVADATGQTGVASDAEKGVDDVSNRRGQMGRNTNRGNSDGDEHSWGALDVARMIMDNQFGTDPSETHLRDYKDSWLKHHKDTIVALSEKYGIPPEFLAGVADTEVGGDPDWLDSVAHTARQVLPGKSANETSVGDVQIQIRRVAESEGLDPNQLTYAQERDIIERMKDEEYNLEVVARHIAKERDMLFPDQGDTPLSLEQIERLGFGYNLGADHELVQPGTDLNAIQGSNYGRDMIRKWNRMTEILK